MATVQTVVSFKHKDIQDALIEAARAVTGAPLGGCIVQITHKDKDDYAATVSVTVPAKDNGPHKAPAKGA